MSGLCGVARRGGGGDEALALVLAEARLQERGAQWAEGPFAAIQFSHRPATAHTHPQSPVVLFLDGEIFPPDLAESSIALLMDSCARLDWGGLPDINGSFCAVAWDRQRQALFAITDRVGSRPLFFAQQNGAFIVASWLRTVVAALKPPPRIDSHGILQLMTLRRTYGVHTLYEGIEALGAATALTIRDGAVSREVYWRPRWKAPSFTRRDAPFALAEALRSGMGRRTKGSERLGLLLSGGLDSRAVLAASPRPLSSFTLGGFVNREVLTAARVANAAGAEHTFVPMPAEQFEADFDQAVDLSNGLCAASPYFLGPIMRTLKDCCDVVFSGHGIDYTLRGMYLPHRSVTFRSTTKLPLLIPKPQGDLPAVVASTLSHRTPGQIAPIFTPQAERLRWQAVVSGLSETLQGFDPEPSVFNAWDYTLLAPSSRHYTFADFLVLRSQVRERTLPFDNDVLDVYFQMPPHWRLTEGVFREALSLLSPELVKLPNANTGLRADLDKRVETGLSLAIGASHRLTGYSTPVPDARWTQGSWPNLDVMMRVDHGLSQRLASLSQASPLNDTGLFAQQGIQQMIARHLEGGANYGHALHLLLTLDSWFRRHPFSATVLPS